MNLDNRFKIIPFCCFSSKICKEYINQKGYFSNYIDSFKRISLCKYGTLENVYNDQPDSFKMKEDGKDYKHFIPENFVINPKEKKYRPYTLQEFCGKFTIGQPIKFRRKGEVGLENEIVLDGYAHEQMGDQIFTCIFIGVQDYTLQELFEEYEYKNTLGNWIPFGVEE